MKCPIGYTFALRIPFHLLQCQCNTCTNMHLVLRLVQSNKNRLKLSPPWEGPYVVAEVLRPGTYKLKTIDGEVFVNTWNIE